MPPEQAGGFVASGFKKNELNVAYEPKGLFGGNPLYRQVGGGPAAIYKAEGASQWRAHTEFTETAGMKKMAHAKFFKDDNRLVGAFSAKSWHGGKWHSIRVTFTALTAESKRRAEADAEAARKAALEADKIAHAQATGELRYGFTAAGFTHHTPLDVRYEPRGTFDGLPLYRQTGCGPAAMCK